MTKRRDITNDEAGTACHSFRTARRLARRELLRVGGLAGFGLTLPGLLRARENALTSDESDNARTFGKAKQVIILFLHGGHPQQETFDPKPEGPVELRGEFGAISSSLGDIRVSELLPRCATIMHKLATI